MVTINLSNSEKVEKIKTEKRTFSKRIVLSVGVLAITAAAYGGLVVWLNVLDKKINNTKNEASNITEEMLGDNVDKILDIAKRIEIISKYSKLSYDPMTDIERLEKGMLPEVYLDDISYLVGPKGLSLTLVANDFSEIVRQIVALKKISGYANIVATGSTRDVRKIKTNVLVTGLIDNEE